MYEEKAILEKSKMTNIIENFNLQLRDKVSYFVRCFKTHSKSEPWLDKKIALFFVNKNLGFLYCYFSVPKN